MMGKVKVCLVGAGRAGTVHADNLSSNVPNAVLNAIVDPNTQAAKELAAKTRVTERFPTPDEGVKSMDFDAVVVATPTFTHADLTELAASAGKHVFSQDRLPL